MNNSILAVKKISKAFGGLVAVDEISFDVQKGETLGIIGPNGAGKTTLFALLTGFLKPESGNIRFENREIDGLTPHEISDRGLVRTFQIVQNFSELSTLENVMVGAFLRAKRTHQARREAERILERVGLGKRGEVAAKNLTMLDQKRLEIAKVLATKPKMILADETMAGLTPVEIEAAVVLIKGLRDEGITFILIEHVMQVVMSLSSRILVIHHGSKLAEGTPQEVVKDRRVIDAYLGED
jgi:branched-chain amino acid transport system ATP-binding protein